MNCVIYKGDKKTDCYLYVKKQDDFSDVPESLLVMMGELEFIMVLDLVGRNKLGYADIEDVRHLLGEQGYFLQMPPGEGYPDL